MRKFFKSIVLGLCSFSLFSCSGIHTLGNHPIEEVDEIIVGEITFEEFKGYAFEKTDYINNLENVLEAVTISYKRYEDDTLTKNNHFSAHIEDGTLKLDNKEDATVDTLLLTIVMLVYSMPNFADLYERNELEEGYADNMRFFIKEHGGYKAVSPMMTFDWNDNGLFVNGETLKHDNGITVREEFSATYQTK